MQPIDLLDKEERIQLALGTLDEYFVKVTYCMEDFAGEQDGDWFTWHTFRVASTMHHKAAVRVDKSPTFKRKVQKEVMDRFDSTILITYDVTTPSSELGISTPQANLYKD